MGLAIRVEHGGGGIGAEAAGAGLVGYPADVDLVFHVEISWDEVLVHANVVEHRLELGIEAFFGDLVVRRVAERDLAFAVDCDAVVGRGEVFGGEPEINGVTGDEVEREHWGEPGFDRLLAFIHRALGFSDHLDITHRKLKVLHAKIKIIQPKRLLVFRRIRFLGNRQHGLAVVIHVVPADLVGAVGEAVRVFVIRRHEKEPRGVCRTCGNDDDAGAEGLGFSVAIDHDFAHRIAGGVGVEFQHLGICEERDIRVLERGSHAQDLGIRLRLDEAGKSIAILTAHALAVGHIRFIEHDAAGRVEGMVACAFEVVGELLDARLVGDGGMRIRLAARWLGGILAA